MFNILPDETNDADTSIKKRKKKDYSKNNWDFRIRDQKKGGPAAMATTEYGSHHENELGYDETQTKSGMTCQ